MFDIPPIYQYVNFHQVEVYSLPLHNNILSIENDLILQSEAIYVVFIYLKLSIINSSLENKNE